MKRRMLALAMCAMMLIGLLTACGGKDSGGGDTSAPPAESSGDVTPPAEGDTSGGDGDYEITVICMALNSDYWHMVEAGAKLAGKDLGVKVNVIGPNAESDSATQINMVEDAINNKVDAIVLAANEPTSLVSAAQTVKNAGTPLVDRKSVV